jgi:hypothetical protein
MDITPEQLWQRIVRENPRAGPAMTDTMEDQAFAPTEPVPTIPKLDD